MRKNAALLVLLCMLLTSANQSLAADSIEEPPLPKAVTAPPGDQGSTGVLTYMVELLPGANQQQIEAALVSRGIHLLYRTSLAYQGIAIIATADQLAGYDTISGIKALHLLTPKQRLRTRAAGMVRQIAQVAAIRTGQMGQGVRIGIIDSGIDYTHATFGGAGTPDAFTNNDPTIIEPGSFPTPKVIGGYDFAGNSYDADNHDGSSIPAPDDDPLDCRVTDPTITLNRGGHGTHVAALAAGGGILDGEPYTGPYDQIDPARFDLPPGIAPEASLIAFKVFGCRGSTALIAQAIQQAVDPNGDGNTADRQVDVLYVAIGLPFGNPSDPDSQAVNAAVAAGVNVVAAVGDTGDAFSVADTSAVASGAIGVGAASSNGIYDRSARGPQRGSMAIKPDLVAPGVNIRSAAAGTGVDSISISSTTAAAAQVAGAAALLVADHPDWPPSKIKAALINTAEPLKDLQGRLFSPTLAGAGMLNLDALAQVNLLGYVDGKPSPGGMAFGSLRLTEASQMNQTMTLYNDQPKARIVTLGTTPIVQQAGVQVQLPTSPVEIPAHGSVQVPVTVRVNPGQLSELPDPQMQLTYNGFGRYWMAEQSGFVTVEAKATNDIPRIRAVHAARTGALIVEVDQNILSDKLVAGEITDFRTAPVGSRVVRVHKPGASADVVERTIELAPNTDYTIMVFGDRQDLRISIIVSPRSTPEQALIQLASAQPGTIIDICIDDIPVASLSNGQSTSLLPLATGKHVITFYRRSQYDKPIAVVEITPRSGETVLSGITQGHAACQEQGCGPKQLAFVAVSRNLTQTATSIRLPYQIFPKAASNVQAANTEVRLNPTDTSLNLSLRNTGARNTGLSIGGAQTPLSAAFELVAESEQNPTATGSLAAADLRYVGATTNAPLLPDSPNWRLYIATASYGSWATPAEVQHRIYLDTTGPLGVPDGIDDYLVLNTNIGAVTTQQPNDSFITLVYRIQPDGSLVWNQLLPAAYNSLPPPNVNPGASSSLDVAPFNSHVMFQMILAREVGLSQAQPIVRFHVETRARDAANFSDVIDRVPASGKLEYNLTNQAIYPINATAATLLYLRPLFVSVDATTIQGIVNPARLIERGQVRMLLLHLHNQSQQQTEVITVRPTP